MKRAEIYQGSNVCQQILALYMHTITNGYHPLLFTNELILSSFLKNQVNI